MHAPVDMLHERQLRPADLPDSADVPCFLGKREASFEYDDVLRPANLHRRTHDGGFVFIGVVKIPHSAHTARRETADVRMCPLNMLRHSDRRALLRALGNQPSYFQIQRHLRQGSRERGVDSLIQFGVIDILFDVHRPLLSGAARLFLMQDKGKCAASARFPLPCHVLIILSAGIATVWLSPDSLLLCLSLHQIPSSSNTMQLTMPLCAAQPSSAMIPCAIYGLKSASSPNSLPFPSYLLCP